MNKAILIGRLGADPILRTTQTGKSVATLNLATETWNREKQEAETTWHRVVTWGKLAENCQQQLQKGTALFIEGKIKTKKFEDQEGKTRYVTEVHADNVLPLQHKVRAAAPVEVEVEAEAMAH